MAAHYLDVAVQRARKIACKKRLRGRQVLARELEHGPVRLRLPLMIYRATEQQNRLVERPWIITCRTPLAVAYVRKRIKELMQELDGILVAEGSADQTRVKQG